MADELVILQAGHENIGENEIARLRSGTGAPDEITFTTVSYTHLTLPTIYSV